MRVTCVVLVNNYRPIFLVVSFDLVALAQEANRLICGASGFAGVCGLSFCKDVSRLQISLPRASFLFLLLGSCRRPEQCWREKPLWQRQPGARPDAPTSDACCHALPLAHLSTAALSQAPGTANNSTRILLRRASSRREVLDNWDPQLLGCSQRNLLFPWCRRAPGRSPAPPLQRSRTSAELPASKNTRCRNYSSNHLPCEAQNPEDYKHPSWSNKYYIIRSIFSLNTFRETFKCL